MFFKFIYLIFLPVFIFSSEKSVVWFTGLPCSGKTTIANQFHELFPNSMLFDGDVARKTINSDLGFSEEDREENLRRLTQIGRMALQSVDYVLVATISPMKRFRESAREVLEKEGYKFIEVFVDAPVEICAKRDLKGMYEKAFSGEIQYFTGVSAPYEAPEEPEVHCKTALETVMESTQKILKALEITNPRQPHALFIGRWVPFHKGHWEIMEAVIDENPKRPLMIFVRNTDEYWSAEVRKKMIQASMKKMGISACVHIIPDIDSVNWGRGVGYNPRLVDVDSKIHLISGTDIRNKIESEDDSWKDFVCPGVAEIIEEARVR